jgi:hypothetical protein
MLCDCRQDVNRQSIGLGEVNRHKLHTRLHETRNEVNVSGETVQLGNDERRTVKTAETKRLGNGGAIVALATLYFYHFFDELPLAAVKVSGYGFPLRFKSKTADSLPRR